MLLLCFNLYAKIKIVLSSWVEWYMPIILAIIFIIPNQETVAADAWVWGPSDVTAATVAAALLFPMLLLLFMLTAQSTPVYTFERSLLLDLTVQDQRTPHRKCFPVYSPGEITDSLDNQGPTNHSKPSTHVDNEHSVVTFTPCHSTPLVGQPKYSLTWNGFKII